MLTEKIKTHNILNGFLFSTIEFIVLVGIIAPFCIYYLFHQNYGMFFISLGIICNCAPIIYFGIRSLIKNEKDYGIQTIFKPQIRKKIGEQYPHLLIDSLFISTSILLPFICLIIVFVERYKSTNTLDKKSRKTIQ